jgi:hypothetical protein
VCDGEELLRMFFWSFLVFSVFIEDAREWTLRGEKKAIGKNNQSITVQKKTIDYSKTKLLLATGASLSIVSFTPRLFRPSCSHRLCSLLDYNKTFFFDLFIFDISIYDVLE